MVRRRLGARAIACLHTDVKLSAHQVSDDTQSKARFSLDHIDSWSLSRQPDTEKLNCHLKPTDMKIVVVCSTRHRTRERKKLRII